MLRITKQLKLTDKQRLKLQEIAMSRKNRQDHIERANIILQCETNQSDVQIGKNLNITHATVRKWRTRWKAEEDKFILIEEQETGIEYSRKILEILNDAERSGAPSKFTAEQVCHIISVACESPEESNTPISHWSLTSLKQEIIKREIVDNISKSRLAVFLNEADIKPHKVEGWIHTPIEDQKVFSEKVSEICNIYQTAQQLHEQGVHVISCDEKTGIQALEREITPMKPGQVERQESEYERHGTQCLIANFEVATGQVVSSTIGDTRTEKDFAEHIKKTINSDPEALWIIIADNLNTHQSESLVIEIASQLEINEDLGIKGKSGILKDMATRASFLSDPSHRIRFLYTPKHASWLNQVEIWFGILVKRLLKRLSVKSTEELKNKILAFIEYFNATMARAFKWTYKGIPLKA
jgi:transposase